MESRPSEKAVVLLIDCVGHGEYLRSQRGSNHIVATHASVGEISVYRRSAVSIDNH